MVNGLMPIDLEEDEDDFENNTVEHEEFVSNPRQFEAELHEPLAKLIKFIERQAKMDNGKTADNFELKFKMGKDEKSAHTYIMRLKRLD